MYLYSSAAETPLDLTAEHDPALLAFVKCHVTSSLKWDVLRLLAERQGEWLDPAEVARSVHRPEHEVSCALTELLQEEVLERTEAGDGEVARYRLRPGEPTTVVLQRLIEAAMTNQSLRSIIAANLLRCQHARVRAA